MTNQLDELLRCPVCRDFYQAAMSLPCLHSFCSLCIRRYLQSTQKCPSCHLAVDGPHVLKKNALLEDVVEAYSKYSAELERPEAISVPTESVATQTESISPVNKVLVNSGGRVTRLSANPRSKRVLILSDDDGDGGNPKPIHSRSNSSDDDFLPDSQPRSIRRLPERQSQSQKQAINDDDDVIVVLSSKSPSPQTHGAAKTTSSSLLDPDRICELQPQGDDLVSCPICSRSVLAKKLNSHIDANCNTDIYHTQPKLLSETSSSHLLPLFMKNCEPKQKPAAMATQRKAAVVYNFLTDAKIRRLLADEGLPTNGDKSTIIKRHKEWILRYNSNLDLKTPKPLNQLRKGLLEWERVSSEAAKASKGNSQPSVVNNQELWISEHMRNYGGQFQELIDDLRKRKAAKTQKSSVLGNS